ncbi:hypothetical protein OIO90_005375 [Microbotryomycetes sp. JL221]|nr:hypothetical protein OIO90_005375 [Microbotryomycetes sp. JL221]
MAKRLQRRTRPPTLSIDTHHSGSRPYSDREPGMSSMDAHPTSSTSSKRHREASGSAGSSSAQGSQRIWLLPSSIERKRDALESAGAEDVPMLSFTAPSPSSSSFPPQPAAAAGTSEPKYLVYAPVMMSAEEARLVGAREIIVGGSSSHHHHSSRRPRSRTHSTHSDTAASSVTVTPNTIEGTNSPLSSNPLSTQHVTIQSPVDLVSPSALPFSARGHDQASTLMSTYDERGKGKMS